MEGNPNGLWGPPSRVGGRDLAGPMDYPDLFRQASLGQVSVSPDGTRILYTLTPGSFLSTSRDTQIHLAHVAGRGEPRRVTDAAGGISSWGWSHDGSHLAGCPRDEAAIYTGN